MEATQVVIRTTEGAMKTTQYVLQVEEASLRSLGVLLE